MNRRLVTILALSLLCTTGCFRARVNSAASNGRTESETGFSLLWGITETRTSAVECPYGLAAVETYFPWYWWLLSGLTAGIVTPIVKEYTCAGAPPAAYPPPPPGAYPQPR